ncbi:MAG TPA: asparagine synthase (glutamine-hydrolyzing) [Thermoanaerobaculia bacterium]|jgi:asparagine synthase (glutamine-hydrolysing)|nr:asparagine synthase (glutamine-hydrolyzing) [Thermoanaerobaculia bacterium]
MCGLTGFVTAAGSGDLLPTVRRMCEAIAHRGPDDSGEWIDADSGVALGFRRLAIIDVSPAGHQPMVSASGRYIATLNGEIYNFEELRRELREAGLAPPFRGHSDTEVMLAAFEAWGVEAAVKRFNGMFAIALWDRELRRLQLVRDRMGVKPLYYSFGGRTFLYGSELKALRQHPDFKGTIDRAALHLYFRFMYVPAPYTIYEGVRKLMPGTILTFDPATRQTETSVYWSARQAAMHGVAHRFKGSEDDASHELEALLRDSIRIRMVADVPLGVFLSGGVDSSIVTAMMQAQSPVPIRTFTVGFTEAAYDEAPFAAAVARHLGTNHTELCMSTDDVVNVIPKLPSIYDEPFADSSQIPTHLVALLARRHVTVSLSGDGGDELFGGYTRYFVGQQLFRRLQRLPPSLRPIAGRALKAFPPRLWDRLLALGRPLLPSALRQRPGERIHKVARMLAANDADAMYFELVSHWSNIVIGGTAHEPPVMVRAEWPVLADPVERMMYFDQISYLPDDILTKVDRASMAVSLEAREPLLDYRLVEFAWTLPLSMKVRAGKGKRVLRRVLDRYVPEHLIERPKMGFGIPLDELLRGPLRGWAESLLDPATMRAQGFLDVAPIRAAWDDQIAGRKDWKYHLWAVLMLQAWLQQL